MIQLVYKQLHKQLYNYNKTNFIKNKDVPVCINCIYFIKPPHNDMELGKCAQFGEKNVITGDITYMHTSICREYKIYCGKNGKYHKKIE